MTISLAFASIVVSILAAWLISKYYYGKTHGDLIQQQSSLESLGVNTFRAIRALNPEKSGEISKTLDAIWAQKWDRLINEPAIQVKDELKAEVVRSGGSDQSKRKLNN